VIATIYQMMFVSNELSLPMPCDDLKKNCIVE